MATEFSQVLFLYCSSILVTVGVPFKVFQKLIHSNVTITKLQPTQKYLCITQKFDIKGYL